MDTFSYILIDFFVLFFCLPIRADVPDIYRREVDLDACAPGLPGPGGPPGPPGSPGEQGVPTHVNLNWRQCAWNNINNGNDNAQIVTCSFTKQYSDTSLYVSWSGNTRIYYNNPACGRWYFTFNGAECSNPDKVEGVVYAGGYSGYDIYRPRVIFGHCNGLSAGSYTVGFHVGNCNGYGNYDCYTGWNSASRISIEEKPPSPY